MNKLYEELRSKAFSAFRTLSREYPPFEDANMLLGSADTAVSLTKSKTSKFIDTDWIDKIEAAIPAIDIIVRNPSVAIEDVDEVLPIELSKHITEKSVKHLAQHTNLILDVKGDEITPSKILNVFHEETSLTYENKFVNTLLSRLSAFVDKRLRALNGGSGIEMDYEFDYSTEFEHLVSEDDGKNTARISLKIELTSPLGREMAGPDLEVNEKYADALKRIKRINMALTSYGSSAFASKLGRNYIRPPVIRTNAILKNKNLKECLNLWEYIESYDKVGYSFTGDKAYELPSSDFVGGMYSSLALQYLTLYSSIGEELENNRLITEKHIFETMPEFDDEILMEESDDYSVFDSEYKKMTPVSRLMNNRKKLSEDEKKIKREILIALKADDAINGDKLRKEEERRRIERERRIAEEEAARLARQREVEVRYRRSFLSRYIQSGDFIKDAYTQLKNELLSYRGVKASMSWAKEGFRLSRRTVARIDVKGKALCLYLALAPDTLDAKYRVSAVGGDCPTVIKIKSERKKKYSLELIRKLMGELGCERFEREEEDYRLPYEDNDALIARGLIKLIVPKGEVLDEGAIPVRAGFGDIVAKRKVSEAEPEREDSDSAPEELPEEKTASDVATEELSEEKTASDVVTEELVAEEEYSEDGEMLDSTEDTAENILIDINVDDIAEEIASIENDESFEEKIDELLDSVTEGRARIVAGAERVRRGNRAVSGPKFEFLDSNAGAGVVIPYTRAEYLALPRKKKKSVLTRAKKLVRYRITKNLCSALRSSHIGNERLLMRIEEIEARLAEEERMLPTDKRWEDIVKKIKNEFEK